MTVHGHELDIKEWLLPFMKKKTYLMGFDISFEGVIYLRKITLMIPVNAQKQRLER